MNYEEINNVQIVQARENGYLQHILDETNVMETLRAAGKFMVYFCSDGRYTKDILNYLWHHTGCEIVHIYADHGGALNLAEDCHVVPIGSTVREDKFCQIKVANEQLGYEYLVEIMHGPFCKAMAAAKLDINDAFDDYATTRNVARRVVPKVKVVNLFHRDKGGNDLKLYGFDDVRWHKDAKARRAKPTYQLVNI